MMGVFGGRSMNSMNAARPLDRYPCHPIWLPETYLSRPYLCPLSQDDPVYCYSTVRLALSYCLITILDMSLRRTLPQSELLNPLRSGAPPIKFGWEGRSGSVLSSTTAFNSHQQDVHLVSRFPLVSASFQVSGNLETSKPGYL